MTPAQTSPTRPPARDSARPASHAVPAETIRPETIRPETIRPETIRPETIRPKTAQAETARPGTASLARPTEAIIARFGGIRPMARAGGWPPSTVQSWKKNGRIPARRQAAVLAAAARLGIALGPEDFFPAELIANPEIPDGTPAEAEPRP